MKFDQYKEKIIGDGVFPAINENGKKIVYADWAASGRLYLDVERKMMEEIAPYYSNIHTELNYIAQKCGDEYEKAKEKKYMFNFKINLKNCFSKVVVLFHVPASSV